MQSKALHFERRILRLGKVIINVLNKKRRAFLFLCHYTPQMSLIISEEFFNMINARDRTVKSMLRLCQYGILKRLCDYDVQTIIPCYEAFSQLITISQQMMGIGNCKLKNVNCEVLENGIVYNLMRQEGTENIPWKLPIVINQEFQRKLILHFHQYNPISVIMTRSFIILVNRF